MLRMASANDIACLGKLPASIHADRWNKELAHITFVVEAKNGEIIGFMELYNIDVEHRTASFGGFACGNHRFIPIRGIRELFSFAFSILGLERIELRTLADNEQAIRFARLFGFRPEGLLHWASRVNGQAKDVVVFALTKDDMETRTKTRPSK